MKKYKLNPAAAAKWIYQNRAEIMDATEGCLLDNLLYKTKRGTAALIETYETSNSSTYTLIFSRDRAAEDYFYSLEA